MSEKLEQRKENAKSEFRQLIECYIVPLLDIKGNCKLVVEPFYNKEFIEKDSVTSDLVRIFPLLSRNVPSPFYIQVKLNNGYTIPKSLPHILSELLNVTEYNCFDFSIKRHYGKRGARQLSYKKRALDLAFELGMCEWLTQCDKDAVVLHTVVTQIINWSSRTYEGKKVPFGIVINFDEEDDGNRADYLSFLNNDSSAVFTDGIFSGILLDKKGHVLSFLTRNSKPRAASKEKQIFVPYQFEDIAKHCTGSSVGVVALKNGEIILIKDQAIVFAKRGNKWIHFCWSRVYNSLRPYFQLNPSLTENDIYNRVKELYCTMLDVSFTHSGGCIALVVPEKENDSINVDDIIKERIDLFSNGKFPKGVSAESKEKMTIMSYLLSYQTSQMRSFFEIERVLRKEIIGLDGATVISLDGSFYCAGSIVAVTSDSSNGGGRTAAAKKLSGLGVGIKISEDGYIEAYGLNLGVTKERIVRLFDFR